MLWILCPTIVVIIFQFQENSTDKIGAEAPSRKKLREESASHSMNNISFDVSTSVPIGFLFISFFYFVHFENDLWESAILTVRRTVINHSNQSFSSLFHLKISISRCFLQRTTISTVISHICH